MAKKNKVEKKKVVGSVAEPIPSSQEGPSTPLQAAIKEDPLLTLVKPFCAFIMEFTADSDPHFVNIRMKVKKTGVVKSSHYILKSDMQTWNSMYESDGWRQFSPQGTATEEDKEQIQSDEANLKPDISATIHQ